MRRAMNTDNNKKAAEDREALIRKQEHIINQQKRKLASQEKEIESLRQMYEKKSDDLEIVTNSTFWKITGPARFTLDAAKSFYRYPGKRELIGKGIRELKENGIHSAWVRAYSKIYSLSAAQEMAGIPLFSDKELKKQVGYKFDKEIKFSIVVPLYNTPEKFLREMIESVVEQTYADWELCMADGSDEEHAYVGKVCREYAENDDRIRYRKLEKNYGISGNTNACLEMATGDYIGLFDHDDLLHPAALHEVMHAICDEDADFIYTDENTFHNVPEDASLPHFKPDFAPDNLRANNYICHFSVFKRSLLEKAGMFNSEYDGSQDYDMILRLTEKAERIAHIPEILYFWRAHAGSVASDIGAKPYAIEAAKKAISAHLKRVGLAGEVDVAHGVGIYRIRYEIQGNPKISILIPNYEHYEDLKKCLDSIFKKTTYPNYEIVIVENNSTSSRIFSYYKKLKQEHDNVKIVKWKDENKSGFNYSAINNKGAKHCTGEYILLLNNDIEVISDNWLEEMLMFAQRKDVGAVGAKLYYPDDTIQHAGVGLGLLTLAGHYFRNVSRDNVGYMGRLIYAQDLSAVTAACMMIRRDVWDQVNGLDETIAVAFNDVDLCMKIRKAGYLIVWTPFAELYHYESKSRGLDETRKEKTRFISEVRRFQRRWQEELDYGDPYYNPNLSLDREDFYYKLNPGKYSARVVENHNNDWNEVIYDSDAEKTSVSAGGAD